MIPSIIIVNIIREIWEKYIFSNLCYNLKIHCFTRFPIKINMRLITIVSFLQFVRKLIQNLHCHVMFLYMNIYYPVDFMLSSPPPLTFFSTKKGGGDLHCIFWVRPISAKKGGDLTLN